MCRWATSFSSKRVTRGATLHEIPTEHFEGQVDADSVDHHGDADHGSEFHTAANAGEHVQLTFVATEAGEFESFCSVPGHRQLGMTLTLIVEDQ